MPNINGFEVVVYERNIFKDLSNFPPIATWMVPKSF